MELVETNSAAAAGERENDEDNALMNDVEANQGSAIPSGNENQPLVNDPPAPDPPPPAPKKHEVVRTDPVKALEARKRRLERQAALMMPEIHFVGHIIGGVNLVSNTSEGAFCRYKIDCGKAWEHLGGDLVGQTQVAYCPVLNSKEMIPFNHPIDCHFAEAGLSGWGSIRIALQCYKLDWCGRRILSGYGFCHLPTTPGYHKSVAVELWRPTGTPDEELNFYLLGYTPALITHDPIYETAWRERCRLVTVSAGTVYMDIFVVTRFLAQQSVDS
eukprot:gene23044-31360_t